MKRDTKRIWKIACQEDKYPGMWQRWFKNQCVAVGWANKKGFNLHGPTKGGKGWITARNAINEMAVGDLVIVALRGHRLGRLGEIVGKEIEDHQWNPLVPVGPKLPHGEMGRRLLVRWDLVTGPSEPELVVKVPESSTFTSGELRPTVAQISSQTLDKIKSVMNDPANWISLLGKFASEKALSDYIASYPNYLEDGMLPHPNMRIRELVFKDKSRLDILLIDKEGKPVIVECKQYGPTVKDIRQLRRYINSLRKETNQKARGILVHGGAQRVRDEILFESIKKPHVEIVNYQLRIIFGGVVVESKERLKNK